MRVETSDRGGKGGRTEDMAPRWSFEPLRWKKSITGEAVLSAQRSGKEKRETSRTSLFCDSPPRHLPRRVRLLSLLPQQPREVNVVLLAITSRENKLRRKLPFSTKEGESDSVSRHRSGTEALHTVVVDEAVRLKGCEGVVDGRDGRGLDVAMRA
jgi:hypothetical protein